MLNRRSTGLLVLGGNAALVSLVLSLGSLVPGRVAAEWPSEFPSFQRDRGWYFYNEPRPRPERPAPEPEEHAPKPEPPNWAEPLHPANDAKPMSVIPTEGPALEAYLRQPQTPSSPRCSQAFPLRQSGPGSRS